MCLPLVYEPLNGIVLTEDLHVKFHNSFGYTQNTTEEFIQFLGSLLQNEKLSTPISSQVPRERGKGSETRVYDPARIMELQERLEEVSKTLAQIQAVGGVIPKTPSNLSTQKS